MKKKQNAHFLTKFLDLLSLEPISMACKPFYPALETSEAFYSTGSFVGSVITFH